MSKPYWEPRAPQIRGCKLIVQTGGTRLFLPPGKGKTSTVLKAFRILKDAGLVDSMLVIAPGRVIDTSWPQEIDKWQDFDGLTYATIHGGQGTGEKTAAIRRAAMEQEADIYLMNIEGLLRPEWCLGKKTSGYPANPYALKWLKSKRVMLVIDESHRFKTWMSILMRTLKKYLPYFKRRLIMTGSVKEDKLDDLFSQCYITDMGADLGDRITHFRREYLMRDWDGNIVPYPDSVDRICSKIAPTTLMLEDDEKLPINEVDWWVKMPPEVRKQYNQLKKEFLVEVDGKTIMSVNAGVLFNKLRQFAQGAIWLTEESGKYLDLHSAKIDMLQNLIEELRGDPLFCMYLFKHDYMRLEKQIGPVARIGGGVSRTLGQNWCRAFGAGTVPLLMAHPDSAAYGIDGLQMNCNKMCWLGYSVSYRAVYQAQKRIVRPGTKADEVYIYRILTDCAVERAVLDMVQQKMNGAAQFLSTLKEHLKNE